MESKPTHSQGMLFMEYYKLWDTPADSEAWNTVRRLRAEGAFGSYAEFRKFVPRGDPQWAHVDRVLCSFEQAGVLMKNELLHPALYFEGWAPPETLWDVVAEVVLGLRNDGAAEAYKNFEWLAERARDWRSSHS